MRQLLLAFQFLTALPIHLSGNVSDKDLAGSMRYYPLAGGCIGLIAGGLYAVLLRYTAIPAALVTAVIALTALSRALHLEGVADVCDGFYAGNTKERILTIMKDSH